ncbi:hypothetical protein Pelo_13598 [Pelomyxa schiedti]|nr:hypothetical protein Pelo_13598 [Pelomyxa schiedti]
MGRTKSTKVRVKGSKMVKKVNRNRAKKIAAAKSLADAQDPESAAVSTTTTTTTSSSSGTTSTTAASSTFATSTTTTPSSASAVGRNEYTPENPFPSQRAPKVVSTGASFFSRKRNEPFGGHKKREAVAQQEEEERKKAEAMKKERPKEWQVVVPKRRRQYFETGAGTMVANDLIETKAQCIAAVAQLRKHSTISVDTEGQNQTLGLGVLQIAVPGKAYIFWLGGREKGQSLFAGTGLKELLESPTPVKLFHDCRADSFFLHNDFGVVPSSVWDSQIAYAIWNKQNGKSIPFPAGFMPVLEQVTGLTNDVKESRKRGDFRPNWFDHNLDKQAVLYAKLDVLQLHPIYQKLQKQLTPVNYQAVFTLSKEYVSIGISHPPSASERLPTYGLSCGWDEECSFQAAELKRKGILVKPRHFRMDSWIGPGSQALADIKAANDLSDDEE